jgi:hypothetical protein
MFSGEKTNFYYLVLDGTPRFLTASKQNQSLGQLCLAQLRNAHDLAPNWEAVGMRVSVIKRKSALDWQVYLPQEPLYDVRTAVLDHLRGYLREQTGGGVVLACSELPSHTDPSLVGVETFGRDRTASWVVKEAPVSRAVMARAPVELGLPGGPCHIIRDIEEESLPQALKQDLIEDIERGKDLSNADADKIYKKMRLPAKVDIFKSILLTSHAQYRMNLRGVTVREIQAAFDEFERWYDARKRSPDKVRPEQQKMMTELAYGDPVRFNANRSGLTIVFAVDHRRKEARLVSTWWTSVPNPPKPKPGQCDFVPYLDQERGVSRPAILGSILDSIHDTIQEMNPRYADYLLDEMYILPEEGEDGFVEADMDPPLSDPESWYHDSYEDEMIEDGDWVQPLPGYDQDGELDAANGNKTYRNRPVNPQNRRKNRERRRKYKRSPGMRRRKNLTEKRYRRKPSTRMKRKRQQRRRKLRGR